MRGRSKAFIVLAAKQFCPFIKEVSFGDSVLLSFKRRAVVLT